MIIFNNTLLL